MRVRKARGPAREQQCVRCPEQALDWATIHGETGKDPWADYVPLCRRCHIAYDGIDNGDRGIGQRRAAQQRAKTYCPDGHEYTEDNTYWVGPSDKKRRQCKACTKAKSAASYRARKAARSLA